MEDFDRYLRQLDDLQIDLNIGDDAKAIIHDLEETNAEEADPVIEKMRRPLDPSLYSIKLYYPISKGGEFSPSPVSYQSDQPITPADLFDSIAFFYRQKMPPNYIQAYIATGKYDDLKDPYFAQLRGGLDFSDVVREHMSGVRQYQDGYLLELTSD